MEHNKIADNYVRGFFYNPQFQVILTLLSALLSIKISFTVCSSEHVMKLSENHEDLCLMAMS